MKILFSANSHHLNVTGSTHFLIDLLKEFGKTTVIPHKDIFTVKALETYDLLIVFQHAFPESLLQATGIPRIIFVPMYDDLPKKKDYWLKLRNMEVSIICFSQVLFELTSSLGLRSFHLQYYPKPEERTVDFSQGLTAFFWQRSPKITIPDVLKMTHNLPIISWHFHGNHQPLPGEISVPVKQTSWFQNKEEFNGQLQQCNFFVAPRQKEGIGMSFLEALSMGFCVMAYDAPTMNEYIEHGRDGLLFQEGFKPLDSSYNFQEIGKKARERAEIGYQDWLLSKNQLLSFLEATPIKEKSLPFIRLREIAITRLRNIYRIIKKIFGVKK